MDYVIGPITSAPYHMDGTPHVNIFRIPFSETRKTFNLGCIYFGNDIINFINKMKLYLLIWSFYEVIRYQEKKKSDAEVGKSYIIHSVSY